MVLTNKVWCAFRIFQRPPPKIKILINYHILVFTRGFRVSGPTILSPSSTKLLYRSNGSYSHNDTISTIPTVDLPITTLKEDDSKTPSGVRSPKQSKFLLSSEMHPLSQIPFPYKCLSLKTLEIPNSFFFKNKKFKDTKTKTVVRDQTFIGSPRRCLRKPVPRMSPRSRSGPSGPTTWSRSSP